MITFQGNSTNGGTLFGSDMAILCPSTNIDQNNTTCDHVVFQATSTGIATITLHYDSFAQFNIAVCIENDPTNLQSPNDRCMFGTEVGFMDCANAPADTSGRVTCTLPVGIVSGQTYDVKIIPAMAFPGDAFDGQIAFSTGGGGGGMGGGGGTPTSGGHITGGGQVPFSATDPSPSQFASDIFDPTTSSSNGSNVKFGNNTGCRFRATSIITRRVSGTGTNGKNSTGMGDASGQGELKNGQTVRFTAHQEDNGGAGSTSDDTTDVFTIAITDTSGHAVPGCPTAGGGKLLHGNNQYHAS